MTCGKMQFLKRFLPTVTGICLVLFFLLNVFSDQTTLFPHQSKKRLGSVLQKELLHRKAGRRNQDDRNPFDTEQAHDLNVQEFGRFRGGRKDGSRKNFDFEQTNCIHGHKGKMNNDAVNLRSEHSIVTTGNRDNRGQVTGSIDRRSIDGYFGSSYNLPPPEKALSDRYIIYRCQEWRGGLGDREKGMVTAYVLSQMLRRKFGIIMNRGCDFSTYVVPNVVNWTVTDDMLQGKHSGYYVNIDTNELGWRMRDGDLEDMFSRDVMYYQGNINFVHYLMHKQSYKSLSWTKNVTLHQVYRIALAQLFRLAPATERKYVTFMKEVASRSLICTHIRMGQSSTIPLDGPRPLKPDLQALTKFLHGKLLNSSKLFVATDNDDVRRKMRKSFPSQYVEIQGKIVHIDRPGKTFDCTGMEKAILDQFVLGKCDVFVASASGFSWIAAILRGTNDGLFKALMGNITKGWNLEF